MDLSYFDEIMNDNLEELLPPPYTGTSIDELLLDGDADLQDLEKTKNDDLVIHQEELKYKNKNKDTKLSWEEVSQHFNKPIKAVAQEFNMCETSFKGRCRELGLMRWPHRTFKSLQNHRKHIQEQGKEGVSEETFVGEQLHILEKEVELIMNNPDAKLTSVVKKIMRQKIYKDNHKKKKMEMH